MQNCVRIFFKAMIPSVKRQQRIGFMMKLHFIKMHSAGNDYIYLDCTDIMPQDPTNMAKALSQRHFSIGSDGLVLILPSRHADARMQMFNADGSMGSMCGNAVRCIGKYLFDSGKARKTDILIETECGIRQLKVLHGSTHARTVSADMGFAVFHPKDVPIVSDTELIEKDILANGITLRLTALSVGNPHAVIFFDSLDRIEPQYIGPLLEHHPLFPERTNAEFVCISAPDTITVRVWERGSGETLACGSGACAAVAAAVRTGRLKASIPINVRMPGGPLTVICEPDYHLTLSGICETAFEGDVFYPA